MNDSIFILVILMLTGGVGASALYYFARFYLKAEDQPDVPPEPRAAPAMVDENRVISWQEALSPSKDTLWGRIVGLVKGSGAQTELVESIEETLYMADLGPATTEQILGSLEAELKAVTRDSSGIERVRAALRRTLLAILAKGQRELKREDPLHVVMIVGVNGAGKTTTIGKLAYRLAKEGERVMIVAGDTFRAAAQNQLQVWGQRAGVEFFTDEATHDPGAVAYAGLQRAKSQGMTTVIVDTAGRLHTQEHLMEELKKMKRVMQKVIPTAPHEILLVVDSNTGQNAIAQARQYHDALGLTGVVMTKLDGTAKGGVALPLALELGLPVCWVGLGENVGDLRPFEPEAYVDALLSD